MNEDLVLFLKTFPGYFAGLLFDSPIFGGIAILAGLVSFVLVLLLVRRRVKRVGLRLLIAGLSGVATGLVAAVAAWFWMMFQWGSAI